MAGQYFFMVGWKNCTHTKQPSRNMSLEYTIQRYIPKIVIWWFSQWTYSMSQNISIMLVWWWKDSESIITNMPTFPKQSKCCGSTPFSKNKKTHVFDAVTWDHCLFLQNTKNKTPSNPTPNNKLENHGKSIYIFYIWPHLHLLSHLAICFSLTWTNIVT